MPRTMPRPSAHRAVAALLMATLPATACLDFVDPILPSRGAPAVVSARVNVNERGEVELSMILLPGLDSAGVPRTVRDRSVRLLGKSIEPDSVTLREWFYDTKWTVEPARVSGPIVFEPPALSRVADPPAVTWYGLRRLDPEKLTIRAGHDLHLLVDADFATPEPPPSERQWFMTLAGQGGVFRLGADGIPPDTIVVPARWIPRGDTVRVQLTWIQSAQVRRPPGDYIGLITLDARVFWTIHVVQPAPPAAIPAGEGSAQGAGQRAAKGNATHE